MSNPNSYARIEGGLTRDAEVFNDQVVHLSVAVDNAGSEKGVSYPAGYFDVKIWLTPSDYTPAALAKQVRKALDEGTLKKGARIKVSGDLKQERWEKDGQKGSRVVIMADLIDMYVPGQAKGAAAPRREAVSTETVETAAPAQDSGKMYQMGEEF